MTREVLFRGKRIDNGKWIEGNLFVSDTDGRTHILVGTRRITIEWEVDPSTVGQFTGLTDNHGNKIFEGDIVQAHFTTNHSKQIFRVTFDDGMFIFNNGHVKLPVRGIYGIKVIGNIHDNPDLLEVHND